MNLQNHQIFSDCPGGAFKFFAFFCFAVACGLMAGSLQQKAMSPRMAAKPNVGAQVPGPATSFSSFSHHGF